MLNDGTRRLVRDIVDADEEADSGFGASPGDAVRERYYDPKVGRFLTKDPEPPTENDAINPYRYAWNDPINMNDPTGLGAFRAAGSAFGSAFGEFGAAIGGTIGGMLDPKPVSAPAHSAPMTSSLALNLGTSPISASSMLTLGTRWGPAPQNLPSMENTGLPTQADLDRWAGVEQRSSEEKTRAQYDAEAQWRWTHDPNDGTHQYLIAIGGLPRDSERMIGGRYVGATSEALDERMTQLWAEGRGMSRLQIFSELHQHDVANQMAAVAFAPSVARDIRPPSISTNVSRAWQVPETPPIAPANGSARAMAQRIEGVAERSFEFAVNNPRKAGLTRQELGIDAHVQATRWLRRWATRNNVPMGPGGLQFELPGAHSRPDVVFHPTRQIFDFKLSPLARRRTQTQNIIEDFPGYDLRYIYGPDLWR